MLQDTSAYLNKTVGNALCGEISVAAGATVNWGPYNSTVSANNQIADDANVTLTSTSRLMLYANDWFPNQAATTFPVNSDTIGKLSVTTGAKVHTGVKAGGWGGVLSVSELWIDGVRQPDESVVEDATGSGLVRGNGYIQVNGSAAPAGPPTVYKLDGVGGTASFYLSRQVTSTIPGLMIGNCVDNVNSTGFTGPVNLNSYQLTIQKNNSNGAISGSGVLVVAGGSIGGSTGNTYTGTTTLTGNVVLNKTVGNALCGNISVAAGKTVSWSVGGAVSANDQIADDANVTLTSTSKLMLYGSESFPNQTTNNFPVNSDTIGKLSVTTGAKLYTGIKASGWGGVLSVSELWIDGVRQADVSVVEDATGSGLVRGNGWIQVNGSAAPSGPAPTTFRMDGTGDFYIKRQVLPPITGVMIGNCADTSFGNGFTAPVNLNGWQFTTVTTGGNNGAISGNGVLIAKGSFGGATGNAYTGTTTVTGAVTLAKTVGNALCGDITVGVSSSLTWSSANQISNLSNMALTTSTSALNLNSKADTLAALTLATGALVNTGGATGVLTVSALTVNGTSMTGGPYTLATNPEFITGAGSVVVAPLGAAMDTTTTVVSSQNPSAYGVAVTFTATITPTSGSAFPVGSVQFKVDGANKGSPVMIVAGSPASNGTAASAAINIAAGSARVVTAEYIPDDNFVASIGTLNQEVIAPPDPVATTTTVASSKNPSVYGDAVTFTATIVPASGSVFPGGTVQFKVDGTNKGSAITVTAGSPTSNGTAISASFTDIAVGSARAVTAVYSPSGIISSGNFVTSTGTLSDGQTVNAPPPAVTTSTTVVSAKNPSVFGDPATFTATVVPASGSVFPGGTVQFKVDGTNKGSAITVTAGSPTSNGTAVSASFTDIAVGSAHAVTAVYSPSGIISSGNFVTSTGTLSGGQTVNAPPPAVTTTTTVACSEVPAYFGDPLKFTATIVPASGAVFPGGTVQFKVDGTNKGSAVAVVAGRPTSNGTAVSISVSDFAVGSSHVVTAEYTPSGIIPGGNFVTSIGTLSPNPVVNEAFTGTKIAAGTTRNWTGSNAINNTATDVLVPATSSLMLYASESFPNESFPRTVYSDIIGALYVTTGAKVWTGLTTNGWGGVLSVTELYIDGVQQEHTSVVENADGSGLVRGNGWIQVGGSAAPAGYPDTPPATFKLDGTGDFYIARQISQYQTAPATAGLLIADISNNINSSNSYPSGGFGAALQLNEHTLTLNSGWNNNGAISGNGAVHFVGTGGIQGSFGPNTYTGETTVSGYLVLQKSQGDALCGNITLGAATHIQLYLSNQIADAATLTLAATSQVSLFNYYTPGTGLSDSCAGLTLVDGALVNTGTGTAGKLTVTTLTVNGVVMPAGDYTSSSSAFVTGAGTVVVPGPPVTTITTVVSSNYTTTVGDPVTFTATIAPASGSAFPAGTVQFKVDGVNKGSAATVTAGSSPNGTAVSASITDIAVGSAHVVTAEYTPDGNFVTSTGTLSPVQEVRSLYDTWSNSSFANAFNDKTSTGNPDLDTLTNLQEYAFGTDPTVSTSGSITYATGVVTAHGSPTTQITNITNGVDFRAVFGRRKDYVAAGLTYTVQFSAGLDVWVTSGVTPTVLASDATIDAVSVPYPLFITTARGVEKPTFFRVGVNDSTTPQQQP